jgi:hypothetical protein
MLFLFRILPEEAFTHEGFKDDQFYLYFSYKPKNKNKLSVFIFFCGIQTPAQNFQEISSSEESLP